MKKRAAIAVLLAFACGVLALVVAWPSLSQRLGVYALEQVSSLLVGDFHVERVASLKPWNLRLEGVRIDGPDGKPVVTADSLETAIHLSDLIELRITLPRVRLRGAEVSLRDLPDDLVIAETFLPVPEEEPVEDETPPSALRVSVEDILVTELSVVDLPEGYVLELPETRGRVRYGPKGTRVEISSAQLVAKRPGQEVARGSLSGQLVLIEGEQSSLAVQLSAGDSALEAKASVGYGVEGFELPSGEADMTLDPSLPARAGLDDLPVQLHAPVRVQARFDGPKRRGEVDVQTEGGDVQIRAEASGEPYRLEVLTERLDLRPTLGADAPPVLGGDLELELTPREGENHFAYDLRLARGRVDDVRLPTLWLEGDIDPTSVRVASLRVPKWTRAGDRVQLSGRVTDAGRVRIDLSAALKKPLLSGLVKQLSGFEAREAKVEVHGTYDHERGRVDAKVTLSAKEIAGYDVRLARLSADVDAKGSVLRPRLDARLHLSDLELPGATLPEIEAQLVGFESYTGTLGIRGEHAGIVGSVSAQLRKDSASVQGSFTTRFEDGKQMQIELGDATYQGGAVDFSRVRLAAGGSYLTMDGRVDPDGPNDLSLALSGLDLALLSKLPALERHLEPYALAGELSGNVRLRGTFAQPRLVAELRGQGMGAGGAKLGTLRVQLEYAERSDDLSLHLEVDPPKLDRLTLTLTGQMPPGHRLDESLRRGRYRLEVDGIVTDVSSYAALHPELEKITGGIEVEGQAEGTEREGITGEVRVGTVQVAYEGLGPANLRAELSLTPERTELTASLADDDGELAHASASVEAGVVSLAKGPHPPDAAWTLSAQVPRRRLDDFPEPANIDLPLRLAARVDAKGRRLRLQELELKADASWVGDPPPGAPAQCLARDRFFALSASLGEGRLDVNGDLSIDGRSVLDLVIEGSVPDVPLDTLNPLDSRGRARVHAEGLELGSLPGLCGRMRGTLRADLTADGFFAGQPDVKADMRVEGLGSTEGGTLDVHLTAQADAKGARAQLEARDKGVAVLDAEAKLPWTWGGLAMPEDMPSVPQARVELSRLPLETISAPVRSTARLRGHVTGELHTKTRAEQLALEGQLRLDDVHLSLSDPALRLERINGKLTVDERKLRFENLRWGDREGRLRTSGEVELAGLKPRSAHIRVEAEDLPLRSDGLAFATINTHLQVDANLEASPAEVEVSIQDLSVALNDELTRSSQDLDQHPDVIYVDSLAEEQEADVEQAVEKPVAFNARIEVATPKPFWVRHQDFAVQIQPKLQINTGPDGARIAGPVFIRRGYVSLVGRTFNFERGEIRFAGGRQIDPTVDMVARHYLSGGEYVQVRIGGYLSRPELAFSTNVAGVGNNETEIMALLVRGKPGEGSASASAEAAAMLSGLTAGFLSSLTRGKYGEYVPVLALEAGSSTGTRLRAGVQMDDFVPKALRGIVQGAYVEGYVGGGGNDQGGQGGMGGFLIELYMPHDITTSGAYDEPSNWSIDLLWEPLR